MRVLLLLGMLVGCGTYNYNRAALVPHATPRMTSGQPMSGRGQLDLGASSVAHFGDPGVGDPDAGVELPGTQAHGGLKVRLGDNMSLGAIYEEGLDAGARPIKPTLAPVENGNVRGYGIAFDAALATGDPRVRVGIGVETTVWSVPYVEYMSCVAGTDCFPENVVETGRDQIATIAVSVTPSFRANDVITVFGGVTARQHPTIQQKGVEVDPILDDGGDVESGPVNFLGAVGAELSLLDGALLASAVAYYDFSQTPVAYKPGLGVMLSIPFGRTKPAAPTAPQGPPGYAPGP